MIIVDEVSWRSHDDFDQLAPLFVDRSKRVSV
jgi:hypothetical protein